MRKHWVYKLSIQQVALIFEAKDLSCFGIFNRNKKHLQFTHEYNELFNSGSDKKHFNAKKFLLKLYIKHQKLRAMYDALTTCEAVNSNAEFKLMFGKEFKTINDLKLVTNEANRINDKMGVLNQPQEKGNDISFSQLVIMIETSRNIPINRNIKLYEFYEMYKNELSKAA